VQLTPCFAARASCGARQSSPLQRTCCSAAAPDDLCARRGSNPLHLQDPFLAARADATPVTRNSPVRPKYTQKPLLLRRFYP
jgi:hypothetical protein